MKICIVRLSAMGDIIMILPLIRTLQKNFPQASITWVIDQSFYPLVSNIQGIRFFVIQKKSLKNGIGKVFSLLRKEVFDVLLATQTSFTANMLYPCIRAKRKIGFSYKNSRDGHFLWVNEHIFPQKEHHVDVFLRFADILNAKEKDLDRTLCLEEKDYKIQKTLPESYIVIHPISSKTFKNWSLQSWRQVIAYIEKHSFCSIVITGSCADWAFAEQMQQGTKRVINLCGKTTLRELAACISKALAVIAPDTGALHIASAYNIKAIGLYAATSHLYAGPYKHTDFVIDKHLEAFRRFGRRFFKRSRVCHEDTMSLISNFDVNYQLDKIL